MKISLTEEMVQTQPQECYYHPPVIWRMFRIEYNGGHCGCPEGRIWAPETVDPDKLEKAINKGLIAMWNPDELGEGYE